ncbi:UNVERIFIED_CONTAM: hypothetical protein ABIC26_004685 [Paenibacillus sp. PvR008]
MWQGCAESFSLPDAKDGLLCLHAAGMPEAEWDHVHASLQLRLRRRFFIFIRLKLVKGEKCRSVLTNAKIGETRSGVKMRQGNGGK